jgi:hypothetical protein
MENGVFTYYYMEGLHHNDAIEGAYDYAAPLAHDYLWLNFHIVMDPQLFDNYDGDWNF